MSGDDYRSTMAHDCAEQIVAMLNDPAVGFRDAKGFTRLQPADIAVLVRDRKEAGAMRYALQERLVSSVYLSDKDSVIESLEAQDVLRWLNAVANPLDGALARAAFASATVQLSLAELARLASDEQAWEQRVEQLKALHLVWQRQGVLAMLRRFIHELGLPKLLLQQAGGERSLTNLLHLAELLQGASAELDGEQALIRWLAEQIDSQGQDDERVLRLESDADLVKVVTVHKSKGLEYPLVFLPFAGSAKPTSRKHKAFFEFVDAAGVRQLDQTLSDEALAYVERGRIEEDLRLLYVALTRARHYLWLGVAPWSAHGGSNNALHLSALGYLLSEGAPIDGDQLCALWNQIDGAGSEIAVIRLGEQQGVTLLAREQWQAPLVAAPDYDGQFERNWSVGSFTSLTRQTGMLAAPTRARHETLLEDDAAGAAAAGADTAWHRYPRGSVPGNFLHEQLEWMANEGFTCANDSTFEERMGQRCQRAGWANRQADTVTWLRAAVSTPLPPLGVALEAIGEALPEMEFWFPSLQLSSRAVDQLCGARLLGGQGRPALPERQLHGMLKGFADLVFEHAGRYWVLDYKSNWLGVADPGYNMVNLASAMAQHRYDVQGAIYLLALHRLLKARLGSAYDPQRQLGGAIFYFLRGVGNAKTRGCYHIGPDLGLLDGLDRLLGEESGA